MKLPDKDTVERVHGFLRREIWSTDVREMSRVTACVYRTARFFHHLVEGFTEDRCLLRASALTYSTLLSLVPLLAIMFAILKGLGVQKRIEPFVLENLALGSREIVERIMQYIDNTNVSSLGVVGVVTLLLTTVMVLKNMEQSFNRIWKVQRGRNWLRTVTDYLSMLMIAPFCILIALSLTTYFSSPGFVQRMESIWLVGGFYNFLIKMSPVVVVWIALTFCYLFMPNTRVKISSAVLGGIIGGTLWQLIQWAYVRYQFGMAKYNAIYGALSQLPILLVWIYISWVIVLLGAEIAYAHQNLREYTEKRALSLSGVPSFANRILAVLQAVMRRFVNGRPPYTVDGLVRQLQVPPASLEPCMQQLVDLGWIAPLDGRDPLVVFQRPPEQMPLYQAIGINAGASGGKLIAELLNLAEAGVRSTLGSWTVRDLVDRDLPDSPQAQDGQG
jgi:membrane protein